MEDLRRNSDLGFGALLRHYRLAAGFSQQALAERAHMSINGISALERGYRRLPQRETLALLANALALNAEQRLEFESVAARAEARHTSASVTAGPWAAVGVPNLPVPLSSFVGRETELGEIANLVREHRLVTVTGAGGVGKTRTALRMGADLLAGDDVWFVDLAPVRDPSRVAATIAAALGIAGQQGRPVLQTLLHYLKSKHAILILDNCEHLIEQTAQIAGEILHGCAQVRMLATSREPLRIEGERLYRMPSLSVPSETEALTADDALRYEAIALFAQRAVASGATFALTDENAPFVAEICRRLDGIALAIELAAARVKVLTPKQLAQKLDERFRLLTGGSRTGLPRHQTMRALIDWSYDQLSDDERTVFRKLSIFAGGCTLETATAVCGDDDELAMLEWLSSLVEKSLLQAEPSESGIRYALLESNRQYGRERLIECGEETTVARAHASAFLTLAHELDDLAETTPDRAWDVRVEPEMENWRAALAWALGMRGDIVLGQRLASALRIVWLHFAPAEGRQWVSLAAQSVDAATNETVAAALELAEANLDAALGQDRASFIAAERAQGRYRRLGDERGIVLAEGLAGRALVFLDRVAEGEALLRAALDGAKALEMQQTLGAILTRLADARQFAGDAEGARARYAEALAVAQAAGFDRMAANVATNRAVLEFRCGDPATALQLAAEALEIFRARHDTGSIAIDLVGSAQYLIALGHYDEARATAREGLTLARDLQLGVLLVFALQHLAAIAAVHDDCARAARLLGYADARLAALDAVREYTEHEEYDKLLSALRDALGDDELQKLMTNGCAWSEDRAVAQAMLV